MIKNIYKITVYLAVFSLSTLLAIYALSEYQLRQVNMPPAFNFTTTKTDQETVNHGQHLLRTRGCFGCHGQQLQGKVFTEWPWVKRAVAPNLIQFVKDYDTAVIERAIRQGIDHKGRALWSMPAYNFKHLSDPDVAAIIAYLRQSPLVQVPLEKPSMGLEARWQLITGQAEHMVDWLAKVPDLKIDPLTNSDLARGEYLAMTTCNECHGFDLKGDQAVDFRTPNLTLMIKAFNETEFRRLMKQGIGLGGRQDLGLMTMVAKDRFAYFTEQELKDLYHYLNYLSH